MVEAWRDLLLSPSLPPACDYAGANTQLSYSSSQHCPFSDAQLGNQATPKGQPRELQKVLTFTTFPLWKKKRRLPFCSRNFLRPDELCFWWGRRAAKSIINEIPTIYPSVCVFPHSWQMKCFFEGNHWENPQHQHKTDKNEPLKWPACAHVSLWLVFSENIANTICKAGWNLGMDGGLILAIASWRNHRQTS